ncbi:hypothetical protein TGPRC2_307090A, partial [Toxoplasma gondii TgCatPRC2]
MSYALDVFFEADTTPPLTAPRVWHLMVRGHDLGRLRQRQVVRVALTYVTGGTERWWNEAVLRRQYAGAAFVVIVFQMQRDCSTGGATRCSFYFVFSLRL